MCNYCQNNQYHNSITKIVFKNLSIDYGMLKYVKIYWLIVKLFVLPGITYTIQYKMCETIIFFRSEVKPLDSTYQKTQESLKGDGYSQVP